ncbi:MAG: hypothetical protein GX616_07895 [Planctomycetes bacterium]|nr:hypothetical protein [Planctomycetota bacterium]
METVQESVRARIGAAGRGKVFTPKDFLDLGERAAIDQALSRLARSGHLQRIGRGLYHYPRVNPRLRILVSPDLDEIAEAIGRQTGSRLVPSGAVAANRLGLSSQVPARPVYLSDGRTRRVRVGSVEFHIKHVAPKELPAGSRTSAMIFQALRHMGRESVDAQLIRSLRTSLSAKQRRQLMEDARYTTDWIARAARLIAREKPRKSRG